MDNLQGNVGGDVVAILEAIRLSAPLNLLSAMLLLRVAQAAEGRTRG